jgi:hypothetical protein
LFAEQVDHATHLIAVSCCQIKPSERGFHRSFIRFLTFISEYPMPFRLMCFPFFRFHYIIQFVRFGYSVRILDVRKELFSLPAQLLDRQSFICTCMSA